MTSTSSARNTWIAIVTLPEQPLSIKRSWNMQFGTQQSQAIFPAGTIMQHCPSLTPGETTTTSQSQSQNEYLVKKRSSPIRNLYLRSSAAPPSVETMVFQTLELAMSCDVHGQARHMVTQHICVLSRLPINSAHAKVDKCPEFSFQS